MSAITPEEARARLDSGEGYTVQPETGCWIWNEPAPTGQGPWLAFYEAAYGAIPDGMVARHLCRNGHDGCVRPSHVDIVPAGSRIERLPDPAVGIETHDFAQRIRDEREARRMSLRDFAKELRVGVSTLAAWERGQRFPSGENLRWLARYLGWDGQPRKWVVTIVQQRVVTTDSPGRAVREVWEQIERQQLQPRKTVVYNVRQA
jgi:transcriptional regulator with XRE-family HTH domain